MIFTFPRQCAKSSLARKRNFFPSFCINVRIERHILDNKKQEPKQLSKEFAIATKKNSGLRTFISSWNSKAYTDEEFQEVELFDQIGKACQLNVVLSESGEYANVDSVMPIPKGFTAPESSTTPILWDMDNWNDEVFKTLPEWVQEKIKKSTQYKKEHTPTDSIEVKSPEVPATTEALAATMTGGAPF